MSADRTIGDELSWLITTFPGITTPHLACLLGIDDGTIRVLLHRYRRRHRSFRSVPVYATLGHRGRRPVRWLPDGEGILQGIMYGKGSLRSTYLSLAIEQYVAPVSDWAASFVGAWMVHPATIGFQGNTHVFLDAPDLLPSGVSSGYRYHVDGQFFLGIRPDHPLLDSWVPPDNGVLTIRRWPLIDRTTLSFPSSVCWAITVGTHAPVESTGHAAKRWIRYLRWISSSDFAHRPSHRVWWLVVLAVNRAVDIPSTYTDMQTTVVRDGWLATASMLPLPRIVGCTILPRPYAWHVVHDWYAPAWHVWVDTRSPSQWHTAHATPLSTVMPVVTRSLI